MKIAFNTLEKTFIVWYNTKILVLKFGIVDETQKRLLLLLFRPQARWCLSIVKYSLHHFCRNYQVQQNEYVRAQSGSKEGLWITAKSGSKTSATLTL